MPYRSTFGTGSVALGAGQLVVSVDASRDFTYLVAPDVPQPRVGDFLLSADVTYQQGPEDGWCMAIFGFTASEHWFGMKVGPDRYEMTRNTGGLPHHPLDGPKPIERLHQDEVTKSPCYGTVGRCKPSSIGTV